MKLPFTIARFFEVFSRYNTAVWPMQLVLNAAALACIALPFVRGTWTSRAVSLVLSLLWLWMAAAYHFAFFAAAGRFYTSLFVRPARGFS